MILNISIALLVVYLVIQLAKVTLAIRYAERQDLSFRARRLTAKSSSQFAIAQPILSGDPLLRETLRKNVESLPDEVRFIWLVDQQDSEGIRIAEDLAQSFPQVFIERCPASGPDVNPKTFKLQRALAITDRRYFVVLDDDTIVGPDALVAAEDSLKNHGLYTGLPVYRPARNFWGKLVTQFVNNNSVVTYLPLLNFMPPLSINGMFYVVDAAAMRQVGGFVPIMSELCDDYAMKKFACQSGWTIQQGVSFQSVGTSVSRFEQYWQLMHRWFLFSLLLVKDQTLIVQGCLLVLLGLPPILLFVGIVLGCGSFWGIVAVAATLVLRQVLLMLTQKRVVVPLERFYPILSILSELMQPIHTASSMLRPTIIWRSRRIRLTRGQGFRVVEENAS
ncbi:glycosyltransferase [Stieleria sp. JC731]|uniref:glycosyltransferase n=1 Tax=Pirellulaceae TaxID=2691357 RepID=UPI001E2FA243|nr:glycosyltransferase [Stieleria sp. JC731]MCC9598960.1 glycosyltransferase [Stieleria sp. JC731]